MNGIRRILAILFLMGFVAVGASHARPRRSSKHIQPEVKEQISKLKSSDPVKRAYAAIALGKMGKQGSL